MRVNFLFPLVLGGGLLLSGCSSTQGPKPKGDVLEDSRLIGAGLPGTSEYIIYDSNNLCTLFAISLRAMPPKRTVEPYVEEAWKKCHAVRGLSLDSAFKLNPTYRYNPVFEIKMWDKDRVKIVKQEEVWNKLIEPLNAMPVEAKNNWLKRYEEVKQEFVKVAKANPVSNVKAEMRASKTNPINNVKTEMRTSNNGKQEDKSNPFSRSIYAQHLGEKVKVEGSDEFGNVKTKEIDKVWQIFKKRTNDLNSAKEHAILTSELLFTGMKNHKKTDGQMAKMLSIGTASALIQKGEIQSYFTINTGNFMDADSGSSVQASFRGQEFVVKIQDYIVDGDSGNTHSPTAISRKSLIYAFLSGKNKDLIYTTSDLNKGISPSDIYGIAVSLYGLLQKGDPDATQIVLTMLKGNHPETTKNIISVRGVRENFEVMKSVYAYLEGETDVSPY